MFVRLKPDLLDGSAELRPSISISDQTRPGDAWTVVARPLFFARATSCFLTTHLCELRLANSVRLQRCDRAVADHWPAATREGSQRRCCRGTVGGCGPADDLSDLQGEAARVRSLRSMIRPTTGRRPCCAKSAASRSIPSALRRFPVRSGVRPARENPRAGNSQSTSQTTARIAARWWKCA